MKTLFTLIFFIICFKSIAQEPDKVISITVSGSGKTQDEAKQSALRSAIEQAFGAFISSKTEIFNDLVVADQIASVSSGNIQSFTLLNESQLPNGSWGVTLKALVSVSKLTSFVEAKGIAVEIKGGLFAINIKQQILNEQSEVEAVSEMVGLLHEPMQTAFDYSIKSGEPKSLDAENKNWEIPLEVTAKANKNMNFCASYFIKTLTALSLTDNEVKSYQSLNKAIFPVTINYQGLKKTIFLRKQMSMNSLNTFTSQWEFYTRCFTVQSGVDELNSKVEEQIYNFSSSVSKDYDFKKEITINFLTLGQIAASFYWKDKRKLAQIEKMTGYEIKSKGVVSQFKHGGFVVYEKKGHGLVASITDIGVMDWKTAKTACDELILCGYGDWYLPLSNQLEALYENLHKFGIGGFSYKYWAESLLFSDKAVIRFFPFPYRVDGNNSVFNTSNKSEYNHVRALRTF
jgi:hypothetical protein